jgi:hypothetical protein
MTSGVYIIKICYQLTVLVTVISQIMVLLIACINTKSCDCAHFTEGDLNGETKKTNTQSLLDNSCLLNYREHAAQRGLP